MSQEIALATKYEPLFDKLYTYGSQTQDLESGKVLFDGSNAVKIFKLSGEASVQDYSRASGFSASDLTGTWETWTLANDKQIAFTIDNMDNEETLEQAFAAAADSAMIKFVENVDTARFAKLGHATNGGHINTEAAGTSWTSASLLANITYAEVYLDEHKAPKAGRVLYITPANYALLKGNEVIATRFASVYDKALDRNFAEFDGMKVIVVPSSILGCEFIVLHPTAVEAVTKHQVLRVFGPGENQDADAYKFQLRYYHDIFVYDNKKDAVYVTKIAAAEWREETGGNEGGEVVEENGGENGGEDVGGNNGEPEGETQEGGAPEGEEVVE